MGNIDKIGLPAFTDVIANLADGDVERRLTKELAEVTEAAGRTGKAGRLVLTLSVARDGKMMRVVSSSKATIPRDEIEATAFFVDERGGLHRKNPKQLTMPALEVVNQAKD